MQEIEKQEEGSLSTIIYDGVTIAQFVKDSVSKIENVEKEALEMFQNIKNQILANGKDKINIEDLMILTSPASDFLSLASDQSDNRVKLLQSVTNVLKTIQPSQQMGNFFLNDAKAVEQGLSEVPSPLKRIDSRKEQIEDPMKQGFLDSAEPIANEMVSVIHSPDYKPKTVINNNQVEQNIEENPVLMYEQYKKAGGTLSFEDYIKLGETWKQRLNK